MNYLIAKIKNGTKTITYRKILSDKIIYKLPENLENSIAYDPSTLLDENSWYKICDFSKTPYCQEMMKSDFSSVDYDSLSKDEFKKIDYLCSFQENTYFFQKVSKTNLSPKNWLHFGDNYEYIEDGKVININQVADAIYQKESNTLFFVSLSKISGMFKGISELYREATYEETKAFLENNFICLTNNFNADNVKTANRKRIAMAIETLSTFNDTEKEKVLKYIHSYCPKLNSANNAFSIGNEDELKQLLWGIEQRYYTTPVGSEKRVAHSVITLNI